MKAKFSYSTKCLMAFTIVTLMACGSKGTNDNDKGEGGQTNSVLKPLNISIYLDLSDRLERDMFPSQKERDIEIVS